MSLRLLRAEVWASRGQRRLYRVTARIVPNDALDNPVVIAHARLLVLGGDHQRLHEELIAAGGELREGRFARMTSRAVREALDAAGDTPVPAAMAARLAARWERDAPALVNALDVRAREQEERVRRLLGERAAKESQDSAAIMTELREAILAALRQPDVLLSSDSVTLIVQRFCPLAVDSRVSTDDSSPVSLC
jgi:hypothetical protein